MHLPKDIDYVYLNAPSPGETEKFAAEELILYFEKSTGKSLSLISGAGLEKGSSIILRKAPSESEDDAFQIACDSSEKKIIITGANSRSLLFGVYKFLKKTFGISWNSPWPEGEIIRSGQNPKLSDYMLEEKANLKYRGFYVDSAQYSVNAGNIGRIIDWMAKNFGNFLLVSTMFYEEIKEPLLNALKLRGMILEVGHHGFNFFVNPNDHFTEHPEWFSMLDGKREPGHFFANMIHNSQLCATNKEVINVYVNKFIDFWDANPEIDILGIIPNDGFGWCECEQCAKLHGNASQNLLQHQDLEGNSYIKPGGAQYHHIVNQVSQKVAERRPDKKMAFWAYAGVIAPTEIIKELPENMILSIALYERWYNSALDDPENANDQNNVNSRIVEVLRKWRDIFQGEINIYEYYAKYCWQSMPKWMPETIRRDISLFKKIGLQGVLSMAEYDNSILYEVNNLAHYSMTWSSSWTSEELLDDYTEKTFHELKEPVRKQIDETIELMKPYAKLGPRYPEEMATHAENGFKALESSFRELSYEFQKSPTENAGKQASVLEKLADNMRMTSQHFDLGPIFSQIQNACDNGDYKAIEKLLPEWRKAKELFYSSYKKLDGSGVCIGDDVWTVGRAKSLFEFEDELEKLIDTTNIPQEKIKRQISKLRNWIC
jgi:hypothetical protein